MFNLTSWPGMAPAAADAWIDSTLAHYRIVRRLGRGSMAPVFEAEDVALRRRVALKVLPKRFARGERSPLIDLFLKGARAAAALDHPHAVSVLEVDEENGWHFLAMELVEGPSLQSHVAEHGPLTVPAALRCVGEALAAVHAAHLMGIVHRDLKPENLLLAEGRRCKVADFGLADTLAALRDETLPQLVGTPQYLAPEVARGEPATPASDQYSMGATLWFALTGAPPFDDEDEDRLLERVQDEALPDLAALRPDVPPAVAAAMRRALAKEPGDRFESAAAFAEALHADAVADASADAPPIVSLPRPAVTPARPAPRRWPAGVGAALGLAVVGGGAGAAVWYARSTAAAAAAPPTVPSIDGRVVVPVPSPPPQANDDGRIPWESLTPAAVLTADQTQAMLDVIAASDERAYAVRGRLLSAGPSSSGRAVNLTLEGAEPETGFHAVYFHTIADRMDQAFAPGGVAALVGQTVEVRGTLRAFRGRPQIIIRTPAQLQALPGTSP